jgi:hypothetical protein
MAIDFNLLPNPSQSIAAGMNMGAALNQEQQKALVNKAAQEANKQMQQDIGAIVSKRVPTAKDYATLTTKYPQFSEQFQQAWGMLNKEQQSNRITQASDVYSALEAGRVDVAQDLLEEQAQAAENSGNAPSAKAARTLIKVIDANPDAAKTSVGMRLASMMGPDKFTETFTKLEQERREKSLDPSKLTKAQADARKAATEADFTEAQIVGDLQKQGWDIYKIQEDAKVAKENSKIAALNAQIKREANDIKRDQMQIKLDEMKRKRDEAVQARVGEVESARGNIDNMLNNVDRILQMPTGTIEDATGAWDGSWIGGVIDTFDQDVQDFKALMENLDAQAFLAQVPQMRGLGALSENEGKKLSAALQSFNRKQSTEQFVKNLKETQRLMLKARETLAKSYGVPETIPDTPAAAPSPDDIESIMNQYLPEG